MLVLVPVVMLGALVGVDAAARYRVAEQATRLEASARELIDVVRLGFALVDERVPLETLVEVRRFSINPQLATEVLGFDVRSAVPRSRSVVDARLAQVSDREWAGAMAGRLTGIRESIDRGRLDVTTTDRFGRLQLDVEHAALARADRLVRQAEDLDGGPVVARDVRVLRMAYQLSQEQARQSALLLATVQPGAAAARDRGRRELVASLARYRTLAAEIDGSGAGPTRAAWEAIQTSDQAREVLSAMTRVSEHPDGASETVVSLSTVFVKALERARLHDRFVEVAGTGVRDSALALRTEARRAFRTSLLGVLAVTLLALAGAWTVGRGVSRPLSRLAERARAISAGDLGLEPDGTHGPPEVVAVTAAFDEMVAHLQLVQEQATALADGDTTHDSLRRDAPGVLGRSLQLSVARLSQSITAREELEGRLRHEATHDRLTGVLNRASALVALDQGVARAHRAGDGLAVLVVDLDGLKRVNVAAGPAAGDEVLRRVARALTETVRGGDVLARLGADEFVVVAEVDGIDTALQLGERIIDVLAATPAGFDADPAGGTGGLPISPTSIGASVGIALTVDGRATGDALLRDAETAVRRAKDLGGGRVDVFDDELRQHLAHRGRLEAALTAAMARGGLELHFQPIVAVDGRLRGLEALCRWTDAELGPVAPVVFIEVAEASDLVVDLDRWVLQEATRQFVEWRAQGDMEDVYLSVNVSGRHLQRGGVVEHVQSALDDSGLDPRLLVVEITETVLLADLLEVAQHLADLRDLGVRVAVDDFGTGYTSIAHLQRLPVDLVKIDRSFVSDIEGDRGRSLVRLMVEMARTLGLGLVAEGVETELELERLRDMGCLQVQGYLMSRPLPADRVRAWVAAGAHA